jgi:uncharacterized OsmC-like protein
MTKVKTLTNILLINNNCKEYSIFASKQKNNRKMNTQKKQWMEIGVEGYSESPARMQIQSGKYSLTIDEPVMMGGTDQGPAPLQVLLMALAGCLNITGHEVARQHGLNLKGMHISIKGKMNPAVFMGSPVDERSGFQDITVNIDAQFIGVTQEQINSWLAETERRCPVTDNIKDATSIRVHAKTVSLS